MSYYITSTEDAVVSQYPTEEVIQDLLSRDDNTELIFDISYTLIDDEFVLPDFYNWTDTRSGQEMEWTVHTFDLTSESIVLEGRQLSKFYCAEARARRVAEFYTYYTAHIYRFIDDTYVVHYPASGLIKNERVIGYIELSHLANFHVLVEGEIQEITYSVLGFTPTQVVIDFCIDVSNTTLARNIHTPESCKQGEIRMMLNNIDEISLLILNPTYFLLTPVTSGPLLEEIFDEEDMQHMYNVIEREASVEYLCDMLQSQAQVDVSELQAQSVTEIISYIKDHCRYDFVHGCFCDFAKGEERNYQTVDYTVTLEDESFRVEKVMYACKELDFEDNNYHKVRAFDLPLLEISGKTAQTLYHLRRREVGEYNSHTADELYLLRFNDDSYDVIETDSVYSYDEGDILYPYLLSLTEVKALADKEIAYRITGFMQDHVLCVLNKELESVVCYEVPDKILRNALRCKCLIIR